MKRIFAILAFALSVNCVFSQSNFIDNEIIKPRVRIIIDNDFGGDPDGFYGLSGTATVVCGAGLTDIASACLVEPKIAKK
jgi:hypothetical protein